MADVIHTDSEALLASKKSFHILHTNRRNTEQMASIGASHNTCHLFLSEITVERKGWSIQGEANSVAVGWNTWIRSVVHHFQFHAIL